MVRLQTGSSVPAVGQSQGSDGHRLSQRVFKVIDKARLARLPDAVFLPWRHKGWLPLAYSRFASVSTWSVLIDQAMQGISAARP